MSVSSPPNRWIPFQCPSCHGVFRLRKGDLGRTGRCPMCRVPVEMMPQAIFHEPAVEVVEDHSKRDLLEKVAVAQPMSPEEVASQKVARKERKRARVGDAKGPSGDWEDENTGRQTHEGTWRFWLSGFFFLGLMVTLGILYVVTREEPAPPAASDLAAEKMLEEYRELEMKESTKPGEDEATTIVAQYSEFDVEQIEASVKGFLTAASVEEKKRFVRDPGRVSPLMDHHYAQENYTPEGFEMLIRSQISFRDEMCYLLVEAGNFLERPVAVERVAGEGGDEYLVDWESWVGYCEFDPEEMRSKRPTEPFVIRASVSFEDYYNYGFSDDTVWRSYGVEIGEEAYNFLGYVRKGADLDKKLFEELQQSRGVRLMILKVAYPPQARAKDQVEILEVISHNGWVLPREVKKDDE